MSIPPQLLRCVASVLVSLVSFKSTDADRTVQDRDRAALVYNIDTDPCVSLNAHSHKTEREAADWACLEAFKALDRMSGNSCGGWRHASCRMLPGYLYRQCSCKILTRSEYTKSKHITRPFRDCALVFSTDEQHFGQVVPSAAFRSASRKIERDLDEQRWQRCLFLINDNAPPDTGIPYAGTTGADVSYEEAFGVGIPFGEALNAGIPYAETINAGIPHEGALGAGIPYEGALNVDTSGAGIVYEGALNAGIRYGEATSASIPYTDTSDPGILQAGTSSVDISYEEVPQAVSNPPQDAAPSTAPIGGHTKSVKLTLIPKNHICKICNKGFASRESILQHFKSHTLTETICILCDRNYSTKSNLQAHIKTVHKLGTQPGTTKPVVGAGRKLYGCDACGQEFTTAKHLREHKRTHTEILLCRFCPKSYTSKIKFEAHVKERHPGSEAVASGADAAVVVSVNDVATPNVCNLCGKRYLTYKTLTQHMKSHTTQATYCSECKRTYSTTSSYNLHMKNKHGVSTSAVPR